MNRTIMKAAAAAVAVMLVACFCPAALAMENDDGGVYTMVDASGAIITMRGGRMYEGDEYISGDNHLYRITAVDDVSRTATAEFVGESAADEAALEVFYALAEKEAPTDGEKRLICMYSTHSDECYVPSDGKSSKWEDAGIYDVGNSLKAELEKLGIEVIYSEETFLPHDADAYTRSRSTAEALLKKGPDALLDIHRDAIPAEQYETTVKGDDISKVRLFVGRSNQNAAANKAFAREIKRVADEKYPGLIKDIYIGKGNYNQELYPQALLLEMGTHEIEKEKVIGATEYMARVLDDVLYGPSAKAESGKAEKRSGASRGIAWAIGLVILAAVVYALLSTGSLKGMADKLRRSASEVSGGLFGRKKDKK